MTPDPGPISLVREGMTVIDVAGDEIGTVDFVRMGDPNAATAGSDASTPHGFIQDVAEVFGFRGEPDLPAALRARLLRFGFIKVDGKNLFDSDRYVVADRIASVSTETVHLSVSKDQMNEQM